ncbi:unnamed protein product [Closterium sp. NIES-54]
MPFPSSERSTHLPLTSPTCHPSTAHLPPTFCPTATHLPPTCDPLAALVPPTCQAHGLKPLEQHLRHSRVAHSAWQLPPLHHVRQQIAPRPALLALLLLPLALPLAHLAPIPLGTRGQRCLQPCGVHAHLQQQAQRLARAGMHGEGDEEASGERRAYEKEKGRGEKRESEGKGSGSV